MALSPGARLGPYEVVSPLGAGGMGEVYKARDTRLDRTVAIKILPSEVAGNPDLRARFEREARAVAALDHPHICGIYDVGNVDGMHYLVMPHLEGQTLAARLEKGPLPLDQALKIATEIADALAKAHRQGIIHRDLKPANIMLTKSGSKLLDFGLAKLRAMEGPISMSVMMTQFATRAPETAHGMILGTVQYMAPEQLEGREADARSDIWALGAVIYETTTGQRPFAGDSPASLIGAILKDHPQPLSTRLPLAPRTLAHLVDRCLAKDPDERWQSARDLRSALDWTGESTQTMSRRSASWRRWVTIVVALLASGVLGWFIALVRAPVESLRALSLEIGPPAGGELVLSILGGGSAISPDGRTVAFVAKVDGVSRLWLRPLDSMKSQELRDTDDAQYPFWSPDGRSLAYFARGYLRRIDVFGGASTILTPVSNPRGGGWSKDGTIVFGESSTGLHRIGASPGGTRSSLTTLATGEVGHRWPRFLPDGRTLFFFVQGERPGVYLTSLDRSGEKQRVTDASVDVAYVQPRGTGPGYLLMVQGDSLVAQPFDVDLVRITGPAVAIPGAGNALTFTGANRSNLSVANDGTIVYAAGSNRYQLTWFGADGTPLGNVGVPDRYVGLRLSPDGTEALTFVDDAVGNRDIWRMELTRGIRNRMTSDNRGNFGTWSPDGQRIAFNGLTRQTLFEKSARSDTGDHELRRSEYPMYVSDWSTDGKSLLYAQDTPGKRYDLWKLTMDGTNNATPILQSSLSEMHGGFSPNGQWIAFTSDESGRDEVYIQNLLDATTRRRISTTGGSYPRWNRKGNELFFRSLDGRLMAAPVRFNGTPADPRDARFVMRLIQPPAVILYPYDIAPDGRILALTPVSGAASDISLTVLVDWHVALQR